MVEKKIERRGIYYYCEVCGTTYVDEEWAAKCEAWCAEHDGSCNYEIIQHAVTVEIKRPH